MAEKTLQSVAKTAKNRMKTGFWNISNAIDDTVATATKRKVYGDLIMHGFDYLTTEELFDKIYAVICEEDVLNPISRIINRDYYNQLPPEAQQLYVMKLSHLFKLVKAAYQQAQFEITNRHYD